MTGPEPGTAWTTEHAAGRPVRPGAIALPGPRSRPDPAQRRAEREPVVPIELDSGVLRGRTALPVEFSRSQHAGQQ